VVFAKYAIQSHRPYAITCSHITGIPLLWLRQRLKNYSGKLSSLTLKQKSLSTPMFVTVCILIIVNNLYVVAYDPAWKGDVNYVHIDVVSKQRSGHADEFNKNLPNITSEAEMHISKYMKSCGESSDPRRPYGSPSSIFEDEKKERMHNYACWEKDPTPCCYELWKVPKGFSLTAFEDMVDKLPIARDVRIVCSFDNDIHVYRSLLLKIAEHRHYWLKCIKD